MTEFFKMLWELERLNERGSLWTVSDFVKITGCTLYKARKIIKEARSLRLVLRYQNRYAFNPIFHVYIGEPK